MIGRKLLCLALLGTVSCTVALQAQRADDASAHARMKDNAPTVGVHPLIEIPDPGYEARLPKAKADTITKPPRTEGRLIVKFGDTVRMRATDSGSIAAVGPFDATSLAAQFHDLGVTFRAALSDDTLALDELRDLAKARSGHMQPDLNGFMYVEGAEFALHRAAQELNDSDLVEFVQWDEYKVPCAPQDGGGSTGEPTGACCYDDNGLARCTVVTEDTCLDTLGGTYFGEGTTCPADDLCEACCFQENCNLVRETADCALGTPTDRGVLCGATTCDIGACCDFPAVGCNDDIVSWDCSDGGGSFVPGQTCADSPCAAGSGACCLNPVGGENCQILTREDCYLAGGYYWGDDSECTFDDDGLTCDELEVENGHPAMFDCYDFNGGPTPFCTTDPGMLWEPDSVWPQPGLGDDGTCGDFICANIDPYCCETKWDSFCAMAAHEFCPDGSACGSPFKPSCYDPHSGGGGCNDSACCAAVTFVDPTCTGNWHADCVQLARVMCGQGVGGCNDPTPNLKSAQIYMTPGGFASPDDVPALMQNVIPTVDPWDDNPDQGEVILAGFTGEGWNFNVDGEEYTDLNGNGWWDVGEPFVDADGDGIWDRPGGLYGFGEQLLYDVGLNEYQDYLGSGEHAANLVRGESTRVAVIDRAMFENHEDLNVIVEPGQTMIYIPEVTAPHHGTAVVGVINAQRKRQNGIRGIEGIAPYADLLFFPTTSVEDGARELQAWGSMMQALSPGDIICVPYGPTTTQFANADPTLHTLIGVSSSLGFIPVLAAGNAGQDLNQLIDLGANGAIVVGGCTPGAPFYRMSFGSGASGYNADGPTGGSNDIHLRAWGANVTTTGMGGLFMPDCGNGEGPDPLRSYTNSFGGTSASAAIVAGMAACVQGLAKQIYGLPIVSGQMQQAFGVGFGTGVLTPARLFGSNAGYVDLDPSGSYPWIGRLIDLAGGVNSVASNLLNLEESAFDGSPGLANIWPIRGEKLVGSRYSLKANDQNPLVLRSEWTDRNQHPGAGGGADPDLPLDPELRAIVEDMTYLSDGQYVDLVMLFEFEQTRATSIDLVYNFLPITTIGTVIHWVELYDWGNEMWVMQELAVWPRDIGVEFFPADSPDWFWQAESIAGLGQRFLRNDGTVLARHVAFGLLGGQGGFGGRGAQDNSFMHRLDQINILLDGGSPGFGQITNGGSFQPPGFLPAPVPMP